MGEEKEDADIVRIDKALELLAEHFESVQIFVTRYEDGDTGTISVQKGTGNWYARYGQVRDWIVRCDEDTRIARRGDS